MKIFNILKKNSLYFVILCSCLIIMLLSTIYDTNVFEVIQEYLFNSEFRKNLVELNGKNVNLFSTVIDTITNFPWTYDYMLIWGTYLFQVLLPFLAAIAGILFFKKIYSIENMAIHKNKKYSNFIVKKAVKISLSMAITVFISFILFYIFAFLISKGETNIDITRCLFLDIFGESFYSNYTWFYYLLDGLVRFFIMPFIYSLFACIISLEAKSFKQAFVIPIGYYFCLSFISIILEQIFGNIALYFNPTMIMASGDYHSINTILAFAIHLLPIIICFIIVRKKGNKIEI